MIGFSGQNHSREREMKMKRERGRKQRERERKRTRGGVIMVPLDQVTASNSGCRGREIEMGEK